MVETAIKRDISAGKALYERAMKAASNSDVQAALDLLEEAYAADPENEEVLFKLAYYLDLGGSDERATELYEILADKQPAREGVLLNLSVLYEDAGRYDEAEETLHRLLTIKPNHEIGRRYYGHVDGSFDMVIAEESEKRFVPRNMLLEQPITDFELSVRARNCLKKMNIRNLGDLLKISEPELLAYKNFGETSLDEIKELLTRKGLRLGQAAEESLQAQRREAIKAVAATVPPAILNKSVAELELSVRASKALELLKIQTLGDIAARTEAELLDVKNFGQTSLDEIKKKLGEFGMSLRSVD